MKTDLDVVVAVLFLVSIGVLVASGIGVVVSIGETSPLFSGGIISDSFVVTGILGAVGLVISMILMAVVTFDD